MTVSVDAVTLMAPFWVVALERGDAGGRVGVRLRNLQPVRVEAGYGQQEAWAGIDAAGLS